MRIITQFNDADLKNKIKKQSCLDAVKHLELLQKIIGDTGVTGDNYGYC